MKHKSSKKDSLTLNRYTSIDKVKAISIVGVLIIHSGFVSRFDAETMDIWKFLLRCFDWSVVSFFYISGLLQRSNISWTGVVKKRFQSLIIPFLFYNVLYSLIFFAGYYYQVGALAFHDVSWKTILLAPIVSPAFQLYFLPYLFFISVLSALLGTMVKRYGQWFFLVCFLGVICYYEWTGYPVESHGAHFIKLPLYFAAFALGQSSQKVWMIKNSLNQGNLGGWTVLFFVLVGTTCILGSGAWVLFFPPLILLLADCCSFLFQGRVLTLLGRCSGSIYVWHTPLLMPVISIVLAKLGVPPFMNLMLALFLTLLLCVLLRIYLERVWSNFFNKPCPRFLTL